MWASQRRTWLGVRATGSFPDISPPPEYPFLGYGFRLEVRGLDTSGLGVSRCERRRLEPCLVENCVEKDKIYTASKTDR